MNPFAMGKIVGVDYFPEVYHQMSEGKRGHKDFLMSRSELMEFNHCPQRWLRGVEEDRGDKATEFGSLVDCIVTAPNSVKNLFAVIPFEYVNEEGDRKPWNFNAKTCKQWKAEREGKTLVKADMMQQALQAEARLKEDVRTRDLIANSQKQVCITTLYQSAGLTVAIKALIDLVPIAKGEHGDCLADLKTDRNASPGKWQRTVFERDYHVQAAMYLDAYNSCPGVSPRNRFLHVIVENVKPFEPARRELSQEFIDLGRMRYVCALERYCQCLKSKQWPGFDDEGNDIVNGWRLVQPESWMIL
jgi:hypothetical protein